jgi:hypothetical protein
MEIVIRSDITGGLLKILGSSFGEEGQMRVKKHAREIRNKASCKLYEGIC